MQSLPDVAEGSLQPLREGARVTEVDVVAGQRVQRNRAARCIDGDVPTRRSGNVSAAGDRWWTANGGWLEGGVSGE